MTLALQITAVGMGIVFSVILLLIVLMEVVVRTMPEKSATTVTGPDAKGAVTGTGATRPATNADAGAVPAATTDDESEAGRRRQAAAAAVATVLATKARRPQPFPEPPTATVSPWQAVMRANQLTRSPR